jgi:hypothetical protein
MALDKVRVTCPVCARVRRTDQVGEEITCQFCGCPFVVPEYPGVGVDPLPVLKPSAAVTVHFACCDIKRRMSGKVTRFTLNCPLCDKAIEGRLGDVIRIPDIDPDFEMLFGVLDARWRTGDLALGEAQNSFEWLRRLNDWEGEDFEISPLPPDPTAEIVQYQIIRFEGSRCAPMPDGSMRVRIYPKGGRSYGPNFNAAFLFFGGSYSSGVTGALQLGLTTLGLPGDRDTVQGEPSVIWDFVPVGRRTSLRGLYQSEVGEVYELPREKVAELAAGIRSAFPVQAYAFIAFRSVYGSRVNPLMLTAASKDALVARLKDLVPGSNAHGFAESILAPVGRA